MKTKIKVDKQEALRRWLDAVDGLVERSQAERGFQADIARGLTKRGMKTFPQQVSLWLHPSEHKRWMPRAERALAILAVVEEMT